MTYQYVMYNNKRKRRKTEFIILTHAKNLVETGFPVDPDVITHNNYFTWNIFEHYWMKSLDKETLPCHYFIENIGSDWYSFKGLCEFQPSYFIEDLVSASVIKYQYLRSMLIVIGEDFTKYPVDDRMSEQLAQKILTDIQYRYGVPDNKILYIDECLTDDWENCLRMSNLKYKYQPAKYFDMQQIIKNTKKFKKN